MYDEVNDEGVDARSTGLNEPYIGESVTLSNDFHLTVHVEGRG